MERRIRIEPEDNSRERIDYSQPFRVVIVRDVRNEIEIGKAGPLDGQRGWCIGKFDIETGDADSEDGNPLIRTDSEEFIWGLDCWWQKEEDTEGKTMGQLSMELDIWIKDFRIAAGLDPDTASQN